MGINSWQSLDDVKTEFKLVDEVRISDETLSNCIKGIKKETIKLENGAEGYFFTVENDRNPAKGKNGLCPMITLIHGGPFGSSPQDMFLLQRNFLLMQGYAVLVLNYRGSTGFGKDFLDSILGHIGSRDVEDCGNLTKMAIE